MQVLPYIFLAWIFLAVVRGAFFVFTLRAGLALALTVLCRDFLADFVTFVMAFSAFLFFKILLLPSFSLLSPC